MTEIIYECDKCGHQIKPGVNFCANCGAELDWDEDDNSRYCEKCGAKIKVDDNFCPKCGAATLKDPKPITKKETSKSKIDIDLLDDLREYPYGIETVVFVLCTAPFILAIAILYERGKLKEKLSDDEIIKQAKRIREYCTWCLVLSVLFMIFIVPIFGINISYKIRKRADALIKDYEKAN